MNRALELSYIQAISLSSQVRLPPPIELPRFISGSKEEPKGEKAKAKWFLYFILLIGLSKQNE